MQTQTVQLAITICRQII